jgi:hypothetical protein
MLTDWYRAAAAVPVVVLLLLAGRTAAPQNPPAPADDTDATGDAEAGSDEDAAAPTVQLRLRAGDEHRFRVATRRQTTLKTPALVTRTDQTLIYRLRVRELGEDGVAAIELAVESLRISIRIGSEPTVDFDSRKPDQPTAHHPAVAPATALVGRPLTLRVRADGTVAELTGHAALIEAVRGKFSDDAGGESAAAAFAEAYPKQAFIDLAHSLLRPGPPTGGAVAVGRTWSREAAIDTPGLGTMRERRAYRVVAPEGGSPPQPADDGQAPPDQPAKPEPSPAGQPPARHADVAIDGTLTFELRPRAERTGAYVDLEADLVDGRVTGEMRIDLGDGMIGESATTTAMRWRYDRLTETGTEEGVQVVDLRITTRIDRAPAPEPAEADADAERGAERPDEPAE